MIYLQLFLSFLQVGMFSFGGGYAALPLIQGQVVKTHSWLSMSEFTDLITISQMTPGPIAVNSATFVGEKIAGIPGALCATAGYILPSCIIVTVIAKIYLKWRNMELFQGVLGSLQQLHIPAFWENDMITFAGTNWSLAAIFVICIFLIQKVKMNPVWVMLLAGGMKVGVSCVQRL